MNRYRRSGLVALFASGVLLSGAAVAAPPVPGYNDATSDPFAGWYVPPTSGATAERPQRPVQRHAPRYYGNPRGSWGPPPAAAYDVPPPPTSWMEPPMRPEPPSPQYGGYRGFDAPPPAAAYDVPPPPAYRERPARPAYHGGFPRGPNRPAWSHPRLRKVPDASNIDSDADGVINLADICPGTPEGTEINVFGCGLDQSIVLTHVKFAPGSENMTDESSAVLDIIAETLISNPDVHVEISGHTDTEWDYPQNMQMSARRAVNVMKYLVDQGVDPSHMIARGLGDTQPVGESAEENNRIEMSLTQ